MPYSYADHSADEIEAYITREDGLIDACCSCGECDIQDFESCEAAIGRVEEQDFGSPSLPDEPTTEVVKLFSEYLDKLIANTLEQLLSLPEPFAGMEIGPGLLTVIVLLQGSGKQPWPSF